MANNWRERDVQSIPETAKILNISRSLAYKCVSDGQIPALKLGARRYVVPTSAIVNMLEQAAAKR